MTSEAPRHPSRAQTSETVPIIAPLMRAEEVATLLSIKTSTVYELSRRLHDPLPSIRIGRSKRYDRAAIARWLSAHTTA
jgi:excisionase family DNA binding protein